MPANTHEGLRNYRKYLRRKTQPFFCIYCGILTQPQNYEIHCSQYHELNSKLCCVWCCGTESWRSGDKYRHVDHLIACFNQFYNSRQALTPRPINLNPTCPEIKSFFDHPTSIRNLLPPRAFNQSIWPPENLPTPPITFQNENLNLAASYLQLYLETRDTHDWMHLMVKAVTMESFLQALDYDDGGTRILDFSCWCDGGRDEEDMLRQHRHMIAVSEPPKGRFQSQIWPRVRVQPSPRPNFPSKRIKKIKTPRHFINTLGYLSKRQSNCNFTRKPDSGPPRNNHFYIFKALPIGYKLPLATLWPDGVLELLGQEMFQNVSIPEVIKHPLFQIRRQWRQKIKDFYKLERRLVIPVEKRFAPTTEITPHFIHLTRDRKLFFQSNPVNETLNQAAWLQMQFEGGNSFYDAVDEETWIPRPQYQSILNDMMPLIEKIERFESENEELKNKITGLTEELKNVEYELSEENEELKNENNKLSEELKNVEYRLTEENRTLKRKWDEEKETCRELSCKLNTVYEKQNSVYERQITKLKKEVTKLRRIMNNCSNCQQNISD